MLVEELAVKLEPGDHVKVEFKDERSGESEWMWVKIDHCDDAHRLIFGRLDNQPVVHANLRIGQELAISYDLIRDRKRFIAS
jgi:uncharacterized protein YegJ (DUF2314 family)